MIVVDDIGQARPDLERVVLTIGSFDGVHRGHRRILDQVTAEARRIGGLPAVLTMRPHPREFFAPDHAPNLLTSEGKKLALLAEAGIEAVFILAFNAATSQMSPRAFLEDILVDRCGAASLLVGHDFRFGKGAEGAYAFLSEAAPALGLTVTQVEPLLINGERVSSTVIRERILEGDLAGAETFLGRKYSMVGEVVRGRGIGRTLGFPTANIKPHHNAVPAHGVYAAQVILDNRTYPAAVNIGIAPTIRHEDITIEAYVFDFLDEIVSRRIELVFHKRLRPERKFPDHDTLVAQIEEDVRQIRSYFDGLED